MKKRGLFKLGLASVSILSVMALANKIDAEKVFPDYTLTSVFDNSEAQNPLIQEYFKIRDALERKGASAEYIKEKLADIQKQLQTENQGKTTVFKVVVFGSENDGSHTLSGVEVEIDDGIHQVQKVQTDEEGVATAEVSLYANVKVSIPTLPALYQTIQQSQVEVLATKTQRKISLIRPAGFTGNAFFLLSKQNFAEENDELFMRYREITHKIGPRASELDKHPELKELVEEKEKIQAQLLATHLGEKRMIELRVQDYRFKTDETNPIANVVIEVNDGTSTQQITTDAEGKATAEVQLYSNVKVTIPHLPEGYLSADVVKMFPIKDNSINSGNTKTIHLYTQPKEVIDNGLEYLLLTVDQYDRALSGVTYEVIDREGTTEVFDPTQFKSGNIFLDDEGKAKVRIKKLPEGYRVYDKTKPLEIDSHTVQPGSLLSAKFEVEYIGAIPETSEARIAIDFRNLSREEIRNLSDRPVQLKVIKKATGEEQIITTNLREVAERGNPGSNVIHTVTVPSDSEVEVQVLSDKVIFDKQVISVRVNPFNEEYISFKFVRDDRTVDEEVEKPTTEKPTTEVPTTVVPTTEKPTTEAPTTVEPTTETPTTEAPTTEAPTTALKTGFVGEHYYDVMGKQVFNQWIFDKQYNSWFFIKADGNYARNEWVGDYYLKNGGYMAKSEWIYDQNYQSWFYLHGNGSYARNEWVGDYYLKNGGYMAKSEWIYDQNYQSWFYLHADGSYAHNQWANINGKWYFFYNNGKMAKGWILYNGTWYYLEESGAMKENQWFQVNGKWYYVNSSGALLVNTVTPDGYRVNHNGEWI